MKPEPHVAARKRLTAEELFALAFGLFLGLAIVKFGNPVILDPFITVPRKGSQYLHDTWPPSWAAQLLVPFALAGAWLAIVRKARWPDGRLLWVLPLVWFTWQFVSATQT